MPRRTANNSNDGESSSRASPDATTASAGSEPVGGDTTDGAKEKIAGYVPASLADSVRDAVAALGSHQDDPASLSEFLEQALRHELARLQQTRNDGRAFPRRARRALVTGRRPN